MGIGMLSLPFVVTLLGVAFAVPSPHSHYVVHEKRAVEPIDWVETRLHSNRMLPMRFGLVQQNLHRLEEMLLSVSHPASPRYGQHFTPMEVIDAFAPSEESISAVTNWLVDAGISRDRLHLSSNKGWIHVDALTSEVENLLNAEYHEYAHPSGDTRIGCHNYSLPSHLRQHVDFIQPTVHFNSVPHSLKRGAKSLRHSKRSNVTITHHCDAQMTPDCLRALYNINTPRSTAKSSFGIVEFTPQAFLGTDLDIFFRDFSPAQVGARPQVVLISGGVVQTTDQKFLLNGESSLDLQYAMSLTNQPVTLLQVGGLDQKVPIFNHWLDAVDPSYCSGDNSTSDGDTVSCGIIKPPDVVSISYGIDEANVTIAFANRQCNEYAKLGMMGTTVIYSSGDFGVAGFYDVCLNSSHQTDPNGTVFSPAFPASCPFVTAVGATQINQGSTVDDPEAACQQAIFSGGGFSNIFQLPDYQKAAVKHYLQTLNSSAFAPGQYNGSGNARGFPDISANGANYVIVVDGLFQSVFGTSASAPVVASMITLINDARIAKNKKPVGFLNHVIYNTTFASAFNDITTGSNPGCGTHGFNATRGWDPVTGVGTPNFEKLLGLFLGLP